VQKRPLFSFYRVRGFLAGVFRLEVNALKRQRLLNCLQYLQALIAAYADCLDDFQEGMPERELVLELSMKAAGQARGIRGLFSRLYGYAP